MISKNHSDHSPMTEAPLWFFTQQADCGCSKSWCHSRFATSFLLLITSFFSLFYFWYFSYWISILKLLLPHAFSFEFKNVSWFIFPPSPLLSPYLIYLQILLDLPSKHILNSSTSLHLYCHYPNSRLLCCNYSLIGSSSSSWSP